MIRSIFKRPLYLILIIAIIFSASGAIAYYWNAGQKTNYDLVEIVRGDLKQEVSVTGRVKPAQAVDLAFERSGRVASVPVGVGDKVAVSQLLAVLDNSELAAQLAQARALLAVQQARLDEIKRGLRPEELRVAQTTVESAQKTLVDAQTNLTNVSGKAEADLRRAYDGALTATAKSVSAAVNSIYILTDIQGVHFSGYDQDSENIAAAKEAAVLALLGGVNAGRWNNNFLSQLNGGVKATVAMSQNNPTYANIEQALRETAQALEAARVALNAVPITGDLSSTERTNLSTEKTSISTEITTIAGKQQALSVQKAANSYNLTTAQSSVTSAQNSLAAAQDQLNLKLAGSSTEEIAAQEAQVRSAQASVDAYQAQFSKTMIRSPLNGIVTKVEAKVGEIVASGVIQVSVLSSAQFEIEANVPEADIAKVKIGDSASVSLDAYGSDVFFNAQVVKINPAETIVEGVTTYKITLQFIHEDERVKSGMTANIDILTAKREQVLIVPQRVVSVKNGGKSVEILVGQTIKEAMVETGLRGSDGNVEILSGLKEGNQAVVNLK